MNALHGAVLKSVSRFDFGPSAAHLSAAGTPSAVATRSGEGAKSAESIRAVFRASAVRTSVCFGGAFFALTTVLASAPAAKRSSTTLACPLAAASISGVRPESGSTISSLIRSSLGFIESRAFSMSCSTNATRPSRAARLTIDAPLRTLLELSLGDQFTSTFPSLRRSLNSLKGSWAHSGHFAMPLTPSELGMLPSSRFRPA
mmetsp:Transcript_31147/g.69952  ORF Transcript_31147/g.69952 Transcript_31147/m.69952 type:complete len:202 (+) Transcript_31147:692-1297(+)